jgi:hypothetical protein
MTTYARLNEVGAFRDIIDLTTDQYHALDGHPKQAMLRLYVIDAQPVPSGAQTVQDGPIVIEPTQARKTWALVDKSAATLAQEADAAARLAEITLIKTVLTDMKNGVGTAAERLARLERVVFRLAKDTLL